MKITSLKRTITINLTILLSLLVVLGSLLFYLHEIDYKTSKHETKTRGEIAIMNSKRHQIESKIKDVKKYKEVWKKIDPKRKTTKVIKIEEVNNLLTEEASKYNVLKPVINMKVPEKITSGKMKKTAIDVYYTDGSLSFDALDDVSALGFIKDFAQHMPGHFITTMVEIKKNGEYDNKDLVRISKKNDYGALSVKANFAWFSYRDKEVEEKKKPQI